MRSWDICDAVRDRVIVCGPAGSFEIPYNWGLAGADGAYFVLRPADNIPASYVAEAKACLRRNRDVVSVRVEQP